MTKKILKIFTILTLTLGSLLFVSIRDIFAAPPVVSGVEDGQYYNHSVTITYDEAGGTVTATLNETPISSGHIVTDDGSYILIVTDGIDTTTINFWIDSIAPEVAGVVDGEYYNTTVSATFTDATATLNGILYISATPITAEDDYILIVTDLAGNVTTINFTIDTTDPIVTGVVDGSYYNDPPKAAVFTETTATLNGAAYLSGTPITADDDYILIVTDLAGNVTTINFTIDTTDPIVTGVVDGSYYNDPPKAAVFTETTATLNGAAYLSGTPITADDLYTLVVTDLAGNVTTITFTIDTTDPVVNGVEHNQYYNTNRTITFNEGSATLNSVPFTSGTTVTAEGTYVLVVTDLAGNVTTITFTIDTTDPVVTGVEHNQYYNTNRTITFNEGSATLNSVPFTSGTTVTAEGTYVLTVTDLAGNVTTINFVIDKTAPIVTGVEHNQYYNTNRTITFNEGSATLNSVLFTSGTTVTAEGTYVLVVTDLAGNVTTINFVIDKTAPIVTGVEHNQYYNTNRTITFNEGSATLNSVLFTSGTTVTAEGTYVLIVTDLAGNVTTINFVIDKTAPIVTGVEHNQYYNTNRTITFNEGSATLNSVLFTSGTTVTAEGTYVLIVTDLAGNVTTINFVIDKTAPIVTGVEHNQYYNSNRTITFNEGSATLNSVSFTSGTTVTAEGTYVLIVTDLAGNVTTINFVIDKTAPIVTGVEHNQYYNTNRTITFNEGSATLNSVLFTSGTTVTAEGTYVLIVTDLAGNVTTINFVIDKTAPIVTGVEHNQYYNTNRTITFNEGSATLNSVSFTSGTTVTAEGTYVLVVTDLAGNVTTINFVIDKTAPIVTGVEHNQYYNTNRTITFNEGSATLNSVSFTSGTTVTAEGTYVLVVTDLAGNVTTINFVIDKSDPVVIGVVDGMYYNTNRTITFNEGTATLNGIAFVSGNIVSQEGTYELIVTSLAGNVTTVNFVIDKTAPLVTGVEHNMYYNTNRTITFNEGSALLNGNTISTGTLVSQENNYTLVVTDLAGNVTTVSFVIDKTAPLVTGVEHNQYYNTNRTVTFNEGSATLNNVLFTSGTTISAEASYSLIVTDLAGNVTTVNFVIDKTAPIITVETYILTPTNQNITVNVTTNEGSLNTSSHTFTENGSFTFTATDLAGNVSNRTVTITNIDKVPPIISGVTDGVYYNTNRSPTFNEGTATLNGSAFISGTLINQERNHVLIVTDPAGNITTVSFTIDKTPPVVSGVEEGNYYNTDRTITFTEGTATLNSNLFTSGQSVTIDGSYTLVVTDLAGNITTINFVLDKAAPIITVDPYNLDPTNLDITVTVSVNEGSLNVTSHTFTENGSFTFIATDLAGNVTNRTITITNIDKNAPAVSGVSNNAFYNVNRTIVFDKGTGTLNGVAFVSGTIVSEEGSYTLIVTDDAGNSTTVSFVIDKTAPIVSGVENNTYYNSNRTITFNEGSATLNGNALTSGTLVSAENSYEIIVTDLAGNTTTINFVLDKTAPIITIQPYESVLPVSSVTVSVTVNEGSLNASSRLFTANGSYTFIATDLAGNTSQTTVVISNIGYTLNYTLVGTGGDLIAMVNSIVVNSGNLVIEGRSIMFTATPAARYRVYAWRLDGNVVGNRSNTYLLNMLNKGTNVTVEFVLEGDLNSNGAVTITDLVKLSRYLAGLETVDDKGKVAADVNNSGTVTVTDLVQLSRRLAGLE
jgi:urease beta subunit